MANNTAVIKLCQKCVQYFVVELKLDFEDIGKAVQVVPFEKCENFIITRDEMDKLIESKRERMRKQNEQNDNSNS